MKFMLALVCCTVGCGSITALDAVDGGDVAVTGGSGGSAAVAMGQPDAGVGGSAAVVEGVGGHSSGVGGSAPVAGIGGSSGSGVGGSGVGGSSPGASTGSLCPNGGHPTVVADGSIQCLGPNLITNGNFANGQMGWSMTTDSQTPIIATDSVTNGQFCAVLTAPILDVSLGWPTGVVQPIVVTTPAVYQLSYQVSSTKDDIGRFFATVGETTDLHTSFFQSTTDVLAVGTQIFTHNVALEPDNAIGVAFVFDGIPTNVTVCVSNVTLQERY